MKLSIAEIASRLEDSEDDLALQGLLTEALQETVDRTMLARIAEEHFASMPIAGPVLTRMLELNGADDWAMARLAGLHAMHGEIQPARQYACDALLINPRNVEALYAIGTTLLSAEQRLANAEEILAIAPRYYPAVRHKALALRSLGNPEQATRCVEAHIRALRNSDRANDDELLAAEELLRAVTAPA
jgi:tetratricopeptide (TPR) repeat protein